MTSLCHELDVSEKMVFKDFDFDFLRGSSKYTEDIWIYIYCNIMDEPSQMHAAE